MKLPASWTVSMLIILMGLSMAVDGRRLALRPLSVKELRRALRESGHLDDTPAGRSVASTLAGISGFVLGITKGVGGSILFDVVTSNATLEYITNLVNSASSSTSSSDSSGTAQEICFRSRSAEGELIQGRSSDISLNDEEQERATTTVTGSGTGSGTTTTGTTGSNGLTCIVLNKGTTKRRRRDTAEGKITIRNTPRRVQRRLRQRLIKKQR